MTAESPLQAVWRALIRFEPEKIVPEIAVRNTLGFTLAVILGTVLSSPSTGVVAGLGALNVAYTDGRDPYLFRARRMLISALLSGVAVALGALSGHSNTTAVIAAGLWAFAAGMLVALGSTAGDLGVITLVTLVVFAAKPLSPLQAIESAGVAMAGGLIQGILATFLWTVRRYEPERRIIGEIYANLAKVAQDPTPAAKAPPMSRRISDAQDALAPLAKDHSTEAERHVFLLTQAERIRLSVLNLGRLRRRLARHAGGEAAAEALARILEQSALAIQWIGERMFATDKTESRNASLPPLAAELETFRNFRSAPGDTFFAALLRDACQQIDALRSQLGAASAAAAGTRTNPYPANSITGTDDSEPWRLRFEGWRARLTANLSLDSTVFRHALRLAICLTLGDALGRSMSLQRTYWIPMTIAIVLKPDFTGTFSRGVLRIGGTLAGLVIATVLFHFIHTGVATDIALMAVFVLLLRWIGPANYGIFVMAVSALVVLLIAVTGIAPAAVIAPRALNTAIGGALALLTYALWPTWERTQTSAALASMLAAYREYFHAVVRAYQGDPISAIEKVRVKGRRARSNAAASVDRMSGEPGVTSRQVATLSAILVHSHSFVHAAMAMESRLYRHRRDPVPAWMPAFAASAEHALADMESVLRHPHVPTRRSRLGEVEAHKPAHDSSALLEIESDRIRTSLRSLGEEIAKRNWL